MRWVPFVSRSVTVRPDEVAAGEGQNLAADPQVKSAFSFVEALGLGTIPPEIKDRTLRMGAATDKALAAPGPQSAGTSISWRCRSWTGRPINPVHHQPRETAADLPGRFVWRRRIRPRLDAHRHVGHGLG